MKKKFFSNKNGFTLIELVLFMGLFSIILGILVNLFSVIVDAQMEVQSTSAVESDSKFITTRLMHDIQRAESILTPATLGAQTATLNLSISGTDFQYALSNGNLELTEGTDVDNLNSAETNVTSISFQRLGNIGGKNAVKVSFSISGRNPSAAGSEMKIVTTTIGLR